ncbi:MAG TPA: DUF692 family protein [Lentibacillus sp.]|uniref:multinuclear nonheme iron-dependent oxidase n=1 Tax=Lentibacillus sp. TaxID=1925746 RepID=UPI002B4B47A1|nr:DUF692 family multinuclear iron-containing protein [Lentibacillus sp.]HLR61043.1 DUF692 family protein [Lentibacillus sp.]
MKYAVNYSPEVFELVKKEDVQIDMFKCPDFDSDLIKTAQTGKPSYVHFALNVGRRDLSEADWSKIGELLAATDTPYINVHLVAFAEDFPHIDINTRNAIEINEVIQCVTEDINVVADRFGAERVIAENVVYRSYEGDMLRPIIDPDVIARIIRETGCGFLLDTAHARMTCKYLEADAYDYISRLPLDHLKELHITGVQSDGNKLRDSMPMSDDDWDLAGWVLKNIHNGSWQEPWVASLEYGGIGPIFEWRTDYDVLAEQIPRLGSLIGK